MLLRLVEDALSILGEASFHQQTKEEANTFLRQIEPRVKIPQFVEALGSDIFKVRWEAAKQLSELGMPAVVEILRALADPQKVGNPNLLTGAYHVLRGHKDPMIRQITTHLLNDLSGSIADIKTLLEAHHLLQLTANC